LKQQQSNIKSFLDKHIQPNNHHKTIPHLIDILPIEFSKQVFITDIGKQLHHLQIDQNKSQIQRSKLHVSCLFIEVKAASRMTLTFSRVSSIASSLNFSLPPFLRMLSQKEASSSALELPATPLLQKTSKASLRAYMINTFRFASTHINST